MVELVNHEDWNGKDLIDKVQTQEQQREHDQDIKNKTGKHERLNQLAEAARSGSVHPSLTMKLDMLSNSAT